MLPTCLFYSLCYHTALTETTWADDHQMVCTIYKRLNIGNLLNSVGEVLFLHDSAKFEWILHTTHFFVTTFFVMQI